MQQVKNHLKHLNPSLSTFQCTRWEVSTKSEVNYLRPLDKINSH